MPFLTRPHSDRINKDHFWQKQKWVLSGTLVYEDMHGKLWQVPSGFIHDYASIPRIFWPILPAHGNYDFPAILHDYTHDDKLFYEAMVDEGVERWVARIMYQAVALDGSGLKEYKAEFAAKQLLGD